jgi:ankyrin repeat protein
MRFTFTVLFGLIALGCHSGDAEIALAEAIGRGDLERAGRIIAEGADVNHRFPEQDGYTVLMMASTAADVSGSVEFLLEHGADPNIQAPNGRSALQLAARHGRVRHVRSLVRAGADPHLTDRSGRTAVEHARVAGHDGIASYLTTLLEEPAE